MSSPKSFSFNLAPGEFVNRWPTPYPTPYPSPSRSQPLAYAVKGVEVPPTPEFMKEWFLQSIIPLVGKQAADTLNALIKREQAASGGEFLNKAIEFRRTLK
jgi:hypothetical protein